MSDERTTINVINSDIKKEEIESVNENSIPIVLDGYINDSNGVYPESVCGPDGRRIVTVTTVLPYKAICRLYSVTKNKRYQYVGTGWLINKNKVITAGHCVYTHKRDKGWMNAILVVPGQSGTIRPYGEYYAESILTTNGWKNKGSTRHDMGAIKLSGEVTHSDFINPQMEDSNSINVCGYPTDREMGNFQFQMQGMTRKQNGSFFYQIDTYGGTSGAPLLINNTTAIGIHNYGGCDNRGSDLYDSFIVDVKKM